MERNGNPFINAKVGDYVKFGRYPQKKTVNGNKVYDPIEWQVLSADGEDGVGLGEGVSKVGGGLRISGHDREGN